MNYKLVILIIVITLSEALGQYLLRLSIKNKKMYWYLPFITWLLYGVCTFLLLQTYNYTTMGKAEVYWDALSAIIVPLIGMFAFNSPLSIINWLGIILIIMGTFMVSN
jgi:multidrug transporter EmrE-like cation transporter